MKPPCAATPAASAGVLTGEEIRRLLAADPPLVADLREGPEGQVQPNGIDLTVADVARLLTPGRLGRQERQLPALEEVQPDADGYYHLPQGVYRVCYNEAVALPADVMAIGRPRSTLLRCGVTIGTAVWDAGYHGRSESLLTVHHPAGFTLQRHSRVMQLVFFRLTGVTRPYHGAYQGENLAGGPGGYHSRER